MNKILIISILLIIVIALIPGYFREHHYWFGPGETNPYSDSHGGCYARCKGVVIEKYCTKDFIDSWCDTFCLGIVYGNCGVNPISAKIEFISRLLK